MDVGVSEVEGFEKDLDHPERSRAERFCFERDQRRFTVAHGVLRAILGRYLRLEPGRIKFSIGRHGKPALANEIGDNDLRFSMAHSDDIALYALARGREVGIDVERIRGDLAFNEIAQRFFSEREAEAIRRLPPSRQQEAFFDCWTRKEAYVKATGKGLSLPLSRFEVTPLPGEGKPQSVTGAGVDDSSQWSVLSLASRPGYAAALAAEGKDWELKCWQ